MLTLDEQSLCEGKLTLQECWEALTSMQNGKSPGNDGFTKKFYVVLFGELGKLLVSVFNYPFEVGELSLSQKQAVITLIQTTTSTQYIDFVDFLYFTGFVYHLFWSF